MLSVIQLSVIAQMIGSNGDWKEFVRVLQFLTGIGKRFRNWFQLQHIFCCWLSVIMLDAIRLNVVAPSITLDTSTIWRSLNFVGQMSFGQMSFGQTSFGQMSFGQMVLMKVINPSQI